MKFVPKKHQEFITIHIVQNKRCNVWAGMGTGKTASVLDALVKINEWPVLVVAPLRVAQSTWPDEVAKWDDFKHLKINFIGGNIYSRGKTLHNLLEVGQPAQIYTINYENIPWLVEYLGDNWPFTTIIADESTKLKGFRSRQGTKRAKALAKVALGTNIVKRFINLTGTPSPNGIQDLWGQQFFIDAGARLGKTFTSFSDRWFRQHPSGFGIMPFDHSQKEVEGLLKDVTISINAADYFDIKASIINNIYITLPPTARKLYKDMEKEMFMQLREHGVEAVSAAARTIKCLQLANGASYVGDNAEQWLEVHDEKIKALESIIEEAAGMPVLVAYNFRSDLDRLLKAFPKGRVLDKQRETIGDWNAGRIPMLFAHPSSAGHGINLQDGGNIITFFGHNWNLEEYQQIIERIGPTRQMQSGHNRAVFVHHIIAENTVDELILKRLETKRSVQDLLLEAMKK